MGELPSPIPQPGPPPLPTDAAMGRVVAVIRTCMDVAQQLESEIQTHLDECHNQCANSVIECQACVGGRVQSVLDAAAQISSLCESKIQARIVELTGQAISKAAQTVDYVPPSPEQISANLSLNTYPYCGPLGCEPPHVELPPVAPVVATPPFRLDPTRFPPVDQFGQPLPITPGGPFPSPPPPLPPPTSPPIVNCAYCSGPCCPDGTCASRLNPLDPASSWICPGIGTTGSNPPPSQPPSQPPPTQPPQPGPPVIVAEPIPFPCTPIVIPSCPPPPPERTVPGQISGFSVIDGDVNLWNRMSCPPDLVADGSIDFGKSIDYLSKKTGFYRTTDTSGDDVYHYPDGWLGLRKNRDLKVSERVAWYICYGFEVLLPGIALSVLPRTGACDLGAIAGPMMNVAIMEFFEHWVGCELTNIKQGDKYIINRECPSMLPGQGEIDDLRIKGLIGEPLWTCWTRSNNNLDTPFRVVRDAKRPRLSPDQAWRLESMTTPDDDMTFAAAVAWEGYTDSYLDALTRLQWNIYRPNEIIPWVVAQVDDEQVVGRYGLDNGFNQFYNDQYSGWMQANGFDRVAAQRIWRAHWHHVSASEAQKMVWRSRPDSPTWDKAAGPVTQKDVDYLRNMEGVAGFWRLPLQEVSRPIPNKRELVQMLEFELIDGEAYVNYLMDYGYSRDVANLFLLRTKEQITRKQFAKSHAITQGEIIRYYINGQVTSDEARQALLELGISDATVEVLLNEAEFKRMVKIRTIRVKAVQARYRAGEFDYNAAAVALIQNGMRADEAYATVDTWYKSQTAKGKMASLGQLCEWATNKLISGDEYFRRLINTGWNKEDATNIVKGCGLKISQKALAKAPKTTHSKKTTTTRKLAPKPGVPTTTESETISETNLP